MGGRAVVADWRLGLREGVSARPSAFPLGELGGSSLNSSSSLPAHKKTMLSKQGQELLSSVLLRSAVPCICVYTKKGIEAQLL